MNSKLAGDGYTSSSEAGSGATTGMVCLAVADQIVGTAMGRLARPFLLLGRTLGGIRQGERGGARGESPPRGFKEGPRIFASEGETPIHYSYNTGLENTA